MKQIAQLKSMRDEALTRLEANADYRLLTSLDQLIADLEAVVHPLQNGFSIVEEAHEDHQNSLNGMMEKMAADFDIGAKEAENSNGSLS